MCACVRPHARMSVYVISAWQLWLDYLHARQQLFKEQKNEERKIFENALVFILKPRDPSHVIICLREINHFRYIYSCLSFIFIVFIVVLFPHILYRGINKETYNRQIFLSNCWVNTLLAIESIFLWLILDIKPAVYYQKNYFYSIENIENKHFWKLSTVHNP